MSKLGKLPRRFLAVYDVLNQKYVPHVITLFVIAAGLWRWLVKGDAAQGIGGIVAYFLVVVLLRYSANRVSDFRRK